MSKVLDLVGGSDSFKSFTVSWFVPATLSVFGFALLIGPSLSGSWLWKQFILATDRLGLNRSLGLVLVSALTATISYTLRDEIFRMLEGYHWPRRARQWRIERAHAPQAQYLQTLRDYVAARYHVRQDPSSYSEEDLAAFEQRVDAAAAARKLRGRPKGHRLSRLPRRERPLLTPRDRGKQTEYVEELPPYPEQEALNPTNFGNRMAYIEGYGYRSYGLDSQVFWYELTSLASEALLASLNDARVKLDTLVALAAFSLLLSLASLVSALWLMTVGRSPVDALIAGAIAALLASAFHRGALGAVTDWGWSMRGLVNTGRHKLATEYGYSVPLTVSDEKAFWEALARRVQHAEAAEGDETFLAKYRLPPSGLRADG